MSSMILHLDEFDEGEGRKSLQVEEAAEQATALLDDSTYRVVAPLTADLDISLVDTTFRIRGPLRAEVEYECGRCLEPRQMTLELDTEFVLMARSRWAAAYEDDDELELADDDMDVSFYEGDEIDLAPILREAMLLELPTHPRCPIELRDACDDAYRRNVGDAAIEKLEEASLDQRWAALKDIKLKD